MQTIRLLSVSSRNIALVLALVPVALVAGQPGMPGSRVAFAQEAEAVAKVRDLNKKAVDAYENLELEEARKFLTDALELCAAEGLNRHAIKATTHLNLGVVLVGGLKQRDAGAKQFRRALEIDPNVKVPKRLNNPEIQAAFEAATKGGPEVADDAGKAKPPVTPPKVASTSPPPPKPAPAPATPAVPPAAEATTLSLVHEAAGEATSGSALTVRAKVQGNGRFERIVLAYRAEGASDFLARDMDRESEGTYEARIPEPAMQGGSVAYYLEARGRGGQALARNGTPDAPHVVTLSPSGAVAGLEEKPGPSRAGRAGEGGGADRVWLSLGVGIGGGYAKGHPEVNTNYPVGDGKDARPIDISNVAAANLLHFSPEIGFFLSDKMLLSVQGRLQLTTGASETRYMGCEPNGVCKPATGAVAVLAKATYLLDRLGPLQPVLSFSAGGGYVRYLFDLSSYKLAGCGDPQGTSCFDTVAGGGLLLGPSVGAWLHLTGPVYLTGQLNLLLGAPAIAVNADVNLGLGYRL
jgi:hypothetical protein